MAKRKSIPAQVSKRLFQESGSACCACGENDVKALEIHHILGDPTEHNESDMLVLCGSCHAKAERGGFSREELYMAKRSPSGKAPAAQPTLRIVGSNNVTAGRDLNVASLSIKTSKASVRAPVMPGTVAEHPNMANYLDHLVSRYNELKKWDCERSGQPMKHALIRVAYQREIGSKVKDTPVERFEAAAAFLQRRIDSTTLGRIQRKQGQRNYSPYPAWLEDKGLGSK